MSKPKFSYVLRVCPENMKTKNRFVWPESGPVEALDWDPEPICGHGLHGWLNGEGNSNLSTWDLDHLHLKWLVVKVLTKDVVDLSGKVKFPRGEVVFCGTKEKATAYLSKKVGQGRVIIGGTTITSDRGNSVSGDFGKSVSGYYGNSVSGYVGTAISGDCGTAISGYAGKSVSGNSGNSVSGHNGTSVSGNYGTALTGNGGTAAAGNCGTLMIKYWDGCRYRTAVASVGENGIRPDVPYKLDSAHNFIRAD